MLRIMPALSNQLNYLLALLSLFGTLFHGISALTVNISTSPPGSSKPLSPTLVSFSLEQDRWPDWAMAQESSNSPNPFTRNALNNYAKLTGVPPKIRVGANSEDRTVWSSNMSSFVQASFPPPTSTTPYPEATTIALGDLYYQLSKFMLPGTQMTWGLNLGQNNVTNAMNMANAIFRAFNSTTVKNSGVTLEMVELGNEPDLYKNNGLRSSNYSVNDYVSNWESLAGPVASAEGLKKTGVSFLAASFAGTGFTPRQIFDLGILDSAPGKTISTISQHRYSAAFCNGGDFPLVSFMSKASVRGNLTTFKSDIAATQQRGLRYILGETGSIACHGAPGVSNTAGAALWVIDYTLQGATLGIEEMFFHQGIGFKYNFFQPIALDRSIIDGSPLNPPQPAQVQPSYYAGYLINTLIGGTGSSQIVDLTVPDDNVSGYAAYEGGKLVRAVFINMHAWLVSSTGNRPSVHIDLAFGGTTKSTATAMVLAIPHADDTTGLTFGGQSFETSDASPTGQVQLVEVELSKGVDLRATEAILIRF